MNPMLSKIQPFYLMLAFLVVGTFAWLLPVEARSNGVMTPFYRSLSGLYGPALDR